jgi:hypothetical protein
MTKKELIEALTKYSDYTEVAIFGTDEKLVPINCVEYVPTNDDMSEVISEEFASDEAPWILCICADMP